MDPEVLEDHELEAAIAASLRDLNESGDDPVDPVSNGRQKAVVDLTADSGDDGGVQQIHPKSKSIIGSETDEDKEDGEEKDEELMEAIALSKEHEESNGDANRRPRRSGKFEKGYPNLFELAAASGPKSDRSSSRSAGPKEEDEDEDLMKAIEISKQDFNQSQSTVAEASETGTEMSLDAKLPPMSTRELSTRTGSAPQSLGVLGLDRKQMEEERLARLAKRKAETSTPGDQPELKHQKVEASSGSLPTGYTSTTVSASGRSITSDIRQARNEQTAMPSIIPSVQFPAGSVKKTWAFRANRLGEDIKIEEVLQKQDLELAVLSSFMWDMEWIFSKVDTKKTRFLMVMQAKDEATKRQYESETASMTNLRLCFPPMDGQVNCMHSKLMLLFHPGYVRIVVPTANLTPYDWGENGGVMENSVFLIDLPKTADPASSGSSRTAFYDDLVYFLKASTLNENIISKLDDFDFSNTAHIAFVHTVGGAHTGDSWKRTGYCGLGRAVTSLGLRVSKPLHLDYVASSIGSLTDEFMRSIYLAAQGDDGLTEYTLRTSKSSSASSRTNSSRPVPQTTAEEWKDDRFRVYFPSETTVKDTKGGPNCAGTICFQSKWYEGAKFPQHVLRDCESRRSGLLMHNKILYVRPDETIPMQGDSFCRGWAYVGSANMSESAWGRLVQDRTTKQLKLNCRNWECGVIIPVIDKESSPSSLALSAVLGSSSESATMLDIFHGTVPVPMEVPGKRFGADRKPWYYSTAFY